MSALLEVALDRRSPSFRDQLRAAQQKVQALKMRRPELKLLIGRRERGTRVELVVQAAKQGHRAQSKPASPGGANVVERAWEPG